MPKLQTKRPPPPYPGIGTKTTTLEQGGIRYESLPQDTRQPVPLSESYHQVAVSGALAARYSQSPVQQNPTRRAISAQTASPVSPLMEVPDTNRASLPAPHIHAPQPQRKSVELRRLDGTRYETERPKQVKVAKDMFEGADPPAYKRQNSDPVPFPMSGAATTSRPGSSHHDCSKCGKKRTTSMGQADSRPGTSNSTVGGTPAHHCGKCGKHKTMTSAPSPPSSTPNSRAHSRVPSQGAPIMPQPPVQATPRAPATQPRSPTVAGPSTYPPSSFPGAHKTCQKCGKKKKLPLSASTSQYPTAPLSAPSRTQQAGLSIMPSSNIASQPDFNIIPPSATTYRPTSTISQYTDHAPLVGGRGAARNSNTTGGIFRNNSLVRSLSRRLSGRTNRASEGPLPSQQLHAGADAGTGRLINMISSAIKDSGPEKKGSRDYQKLGIDSPDPNDRPASPFSFMSAANDDEFEMVDMKDGQDKQRESGSTAVASKDDDSNKSPSVYSPVAIGETLDVDVDRRSRFLQQEEQNRDSTVGMLNVPGQESDRSRPPITRFKSLRQGVSRAASVSRQTSLRRLESLKKVHTNWYRDDMAIEGHNGEAIPVY